MHWNTWHHLSPNVITSENSKNTNNSLWNPIQFLPKTVHTPLPAKCIYLSSLSHFDNPPPANPISTLDPVILVEGQSYRQAAACRSVARPPPRLTWDTDLNGQSINRSSDNGAVSSYYSLHPLRNMNGKKLDCLVWHPTFSSPRRIPYNLVVHCEYLAELYRGRIWTGSFIVSTSGHSNPRVKKMRFDRILLRCENVNYLHGNSHSNVKVLSTHAALFYFHMLKFELEIANCIWKCVKMWNSLEWRSKLCGSACAMFCFHMWKFESKCGVKPVKY